MTLQQIMYFQRVARSGSFTKAARACFVSQTAISRQISALEEELHVTLLERDTAHVKLTLAGEYFFQQVNEFTARLEEAVTRTQTIAQEQQTHLTLGIPTILEQHAISQLLRQYHSLHPEVQLSTVAGSRQQLVSQLVDRKIDLLVAMDFDLPDLEGLDSIILQQVHATWLLPTSHPLAGAEKIAPQQLQGETLILTQEDPRGNTEELLRQYYNQLGLKGNPVLHTRTLEELFLLASAGVGIGLLPSSVPGYLRPDLCSVPIDGPQWNFSFLLISRRERSRASVRAMFELAEHLYRGAAAPVLQSAGSERKPGPSYPDAGGAVPAGQRRGGHRPAALFRARLPAPGPVQRAHRRPAVELQLPAHFPPGAQPRQRARHV